VCYVPILAAGAAEVTSYTTDRKPSRTWEEMEDRFLFYWIYRNRGDFSIDQAIEFSTFADPRSAPTIVTLRESASSLTGQAHNPPIVKLIV
jgi:hypothetical protein